MNEFIFKRNELLAQKVIKGLESRNMTGYYAANKEEALSKALEIIPKGSTIAMGGAMSAHEIGLVDAIKGNDYNFIDRDAASDPRAAIRARVAPFSSGVGPDARRKPQDDRPR